MKGSSEQFTATGTYSDGAKSNITAQVTWRSSNGDTATITAAGLASALASGSTSISATLNGITSNSFSLSVTLPSTAAPVVVSYSVLFGSQSYNLIGTKRNRLPWEISGVRVVFSEPITGGNINSLGGVSATKFSGLGTAALSWNFSPVSIAHITTTLSGTGATALTNAAGIPLENGSGFSQALNVLWGDFNDDGSVTAADMVSVNNASTATYNLFADLNGDAVVNLADVKIVRARLGTSLP